MISSFVPKYPKLLVGVVRMATNSWMVIIGTTMDIGQTQVV